MAKMQITYFDGSSATWELDDDQLDKAIDFAYREFGTDSKITGPEEVDPNSLHGLFVTYPDFGRVRIASRMATGVKRQVEDYVAEWGTLIKDMGGRHFEIVPVDGPAKVIN
jgi:hypothetical protein